MHFVWLCVFVAAVAAVAAVDYKHDTKKGTNDALNIIKLMYMANIA